VSDHGAHSHAGYRHDALLYTGAVEFVARTAPFIRDGVIAGEPVMVVTSAQKIELLRSELGQDAQGVHFADMAQVGANPARIIPFWSEFVDQSAAAGRPFRGIGEPIWAGRSEAELVECQRHESLLNVALSQETPMWLLCPYDTEALEPEVIREALRSHPFVTEGTTRRESGVFRGNVASAAPFEAPLPPPPSGCHEFVFGPGGIPTVREIVAAAAFGAGLGGGRASDLVQAAHEGVRYARHKALLAGDQLGPIERRRADRDVMVLGAFDLVQGLGRGDQDFLGHAAAQRTGPADIPVLDHRDRFARRT